MKISFQNREIEIDTELIEEAEEAVERQLNEYFRAERTVFNLTVKFPDSFTGQVMKKIVRIPYGETRTYGELAENLDTGAVAVGQACGRNPVPVIVPCHRVVGKDSLGGYRFGEQVKRELLELESDSGQ